MMRRLRQLDRIDARIGLGAAPVRHRRVLSERARLALALATSVIAMAAVLVLVGGVLPQSLASRIGLGDHRLAEPPPAPVSTSYAFLTTQPGSDEPVTWDPCRAIRYAINPTGGPAQAEKMVRAAIATVSRLTGLVFQDTGTTDDRPLWGERQSWLPRPASYDVLVSWATATEVPELAGRTAGIGGSASVGLDRGRMRFVSGGATLDTDAFREIGLRPDARAQQRAIVLHELGHVVGLGHVDDPRELMNRENEGLHTFGPGDRAGLVKVGSGRCF